MRGHPLSTIAAVAVVSAALSVVGTHLWAVAAPVVPHYTGCLGTSGAGQGVISKVAVGTTSTSACTASEVRIQFSNGTITGVNAGTGLSGGGSNGNTTLRVAPAYRLPTNCSAGGVLSSTGPGQWACGPDAIRGTGAVDHGSLTLNSSPVGSVFLQNAYGEFIGDCKFGVQPEGANIVFAIKSFDPVVAQMTWWNKDGVGFDKTMGQLTTQLTPTSTSDYVVTVQLLFTDGTVETAVLGQHVDTGAQTCTFTGQEVLG
jgi:hypothetical protein